jgi:SAM-dependent methyltransferase
VLELGSGYGRLLRSLAEPKRTLIGLELDAGLLRLGQKAVSGLPASKRRNVAIVQGDMRRIELARRFDRVLLPYNALYCLLTPRAVERCFRGVRAALEPGGLFAFDVWNADRLRDDDLAPARDAEELARFEHAGRSWSVFERCRRARARQRLDVTYTYVPSGRGAPRSQVVRQRYYRSGELQRLLENCGFAVQNKLGSFSGGRFNDRATRLIIVARVGIER